MKYTDKLNLRKPEGGEYYSVEDFNGNADLIDAAVSGKVNKPVEYVAGNFATISASGNIEDSGKKPTDFAASAHNHDTAYASASHVSNGAIHISADEKAAIAAAGGKADKSYVDSALANKADKAYADTQDAKKVTKGLGGDPLGMQDNRHLGNRMPSWYINKGLLVEVADYLVTGIGPQRTSGALLTICPWVDITAGVHQLYFVEQAMYFRSSKSNIEDVWGDWREK